MIKIHPEVYEVKEQGNIPADIMDEYGKLFSELPGTLPVTYEMKLKPDFEPVIRHARRVAVAGQEKVKQELEEMEQNGIIKKVTQATEWVSSMVAAEKKNTDELRICIDPRDLNQAAVCVIKKKRFNKDRPPTQDKHKKDSSKCKFCGYNHTIIHVGSVLRMAKLVLNVKKETTLRLSASHPRIAHQA